jgi:hypothetical protein
LKEIAQAFVIVPQQRVVLDINGGQKLLCGFVRLLLVDEQLVTSKGVFHVSNCAAVVRIYGFDHDFSPGVGDLAVS